MSSPGRCGPVAPSQPAGIGGAIPSLKDYTLVDQHSFSVEHYFKDEKNRWILEDLTNIEDVLTIRSVGVELPLRRIYRRLDMEKHPGIQTQ